MFVESWNIFHRNGQKTSFRTLLQKLSKNGSIFNHQPSLEPSGGPWLAWWWGTAYPHIHQPKPHPQHIIIHIRFHNLGFRQLPIQCRLQKLLWTKNGNLMSGGTHHIDIMILFHQNTWGAPHHIRGPSPTSQSRKEFSNPDFPPHLTWDNVDKWSSIIRNIEANHRLTPGYMKVPNDHLATWGNMFQPSITCDNLCSCPTTINLCSNVTSINRCYG